MNLSIILATRGRPRQALGVIEAMRIMASGQHKLSFKIACDDDDPADTAGFFLTDFAAPYIGVYEWKRPTGVGACWNRVASLDDGDIIVALTDDAIIHTPNWDDIIARCFDKFPWAHPEVAMAALQDSANPGQATLFVFRPAWFRHCGLFDERFPFWFSDTAIAETYSFITGQGMALLPVNAALKSGVYNPRLREMKLWWTLYACTRLERLEMARRTREALGLAEPPDLAYIVSQWQKRDVDGLPNSEVIVRDCIPNPKPPDDAYNRARAAALDYIGQFPPDVANHLSGDMPALDFALVDANEPVTAQA